MTTKMENNEPNDLKAAIFHNFREKHYNSMIQSCKEGMSKFKQDISFRLYHGVALILYNRIEESINEFHSIQNENDVQLSSTIALVYAHKILSQSTSQPLDSQMREMRKNATPLDFYHSAYVLYALRKVDKALDYLDKALALQSDLYDAQTLKGWVLIALKGSNYDKISDMFQSSITSSSRRNLDATLGLAESYLIQHKFSEALNVANKAIVRFSNCPLPVVLKMRIQFAMRDFEQAKETVSRVIGDFPDNLNALAMNVLLLLCAEGNCRDCVGEIGRYVTALEALEGQNGGLFTEGAKLFSRLCGRDPEVLSETRKMSEIALRIESDNVSFITNLGEQFLMSHKVGEATKYFKTATKLSQAAFEAWLGLTTCELLTTGKSANVDFLLEFEPAQTSARLYFVRAKLAEDTEDSTLFLKRAIELTLSAAKGHPVHSSDHLVALNPDFLLEVVGHCLNSLSLGNLARSALSVMSKTCPGLFNVSYLLAKFQYLMGEHENALATLERLSRSNLSDLRSSQANLLMAQIQLGRKLYERASQSLEVALSHDFSVRDNPIYHYVRGVVEKNTGGPLDAIKSLTTALDFVRRDSTALSLSETASIYIELIEVYNGSSRFDEAAGFLEEAVERFRGSPEEARILILSADRAIERRNVQGAIDLLSKVQVSESYYARARTKLAEVLLRYRLDKVAYLRCYQEMVEEDSSPESYLLLGDAYMKILEPDLALESYSHALQQNPKDSYLTSRMGKALVETHYFAKAVAFYKDSIKVTQDSELKLQLADLYLNLKQYDKAELLLMTELESEDSKRLEDVTYLQHKTKLLLLLSQAQEKACNLPSALLTLQDARDNQNRVRKRLAVESSVPESEISVLVDIGMKLAELAVSLKNNDQAIQFYKEVMDYSPNDIRVLTSLAKLYMEINLLEPCQRTCASILKIDPEDEQASVMMADIAFRKIDFDMAQFHFTQLLTKQPTNWKALVRLVEIMRRTGTLNELPDYLASAEKNSAPKDPNLQFCTALYEWHSGNLNGALRNFNFARQHPEWGLAALYNMVEICLNPDGELGDHFMDGDDNEYRDSRTMALKTADRLLKELRQRLSDDDPIRYRLLMAFRLLAGKEKSGVEKGLEDFIAMASQNTYKDHIGPILGMASAFTLLKQSQRAKNQLKRVAKAPWTFQDAEYLERCWLLLADYQIQSAKMDVATDLLNKVVHHNRGCSKAYEYLGMISEKDQHYREAAGYYECAWRFGGRSIAGIGYKLAYNLMKGKNYADAIDVSQQVLKLSPDYPKVRKDILEKSLNNLRA